MITNYNDVVVKKPWGEEYLCYRNGEVAIWFLYIKAGEKTSMHCHPTKNTGLVVLKGSLELSFIRNTVNLEGLDKIHIFRSRFHSSYAKTDAFLFEVESPEDKEDLVRLDDKYGREGTGYEGKEFFSRKTNRHFWLPEANNASETSLCDCTLNHLELESKLDLCGLSDKVCVVFTSGGVVAPGNKKILYPGDIADGETLERIVSKFDILEKTTVLKINETIA